MATFRSKPDEAFVASSWKGDAGGYRNFDELRIPGLAEPAFYQLLMRLRPVWL
jgi:hypothetical protein